MLLLSIEAMVIALREEEANEWKTQSVTFLFKKKNKKQKCLKNEMRDSIGFTSENDNYIDWLHNNTIGRGKKMKLMSGRSRAEK